MTSINIKTNGAVVSAKLLGKITTGMIGVDVHIEYDDQWAGLNKTAFFRAGNFVRKREGIGVYTTVPWEVLRKHGKYLEIGLEGKDVDGNIVMPTVWATVGTIYQGAQGDIQAAPNPGNGNGENVGGAVIDDSKASLSTTWSSKKIGVMFDQATENAQANLENAMHEVWHDLGLKVESVNGIKPDENGDVEIETGEGAVLYTEQDLTDEQKARARANIGAAAIGEGGTGGSTEDILICESNPGTHSTDFETLTGIHFLRIVMEDVSQSSPRFQILDSYKRGSPTINIKLYSNKEYIVRIDGSYNRIWAADANAKYKIYLVNTSSATAEYMGALMSVENNAHINRMVENPDMIIGTYAYKNGELIHSVEANRLSTRLMAVNSGVIRASVDFASGYQVIITTANGSELSNSGWQTTEAVFAFADCEFAFITVRKMVDGVQVALSSDEETGLVFTEDCYALTATLDDLEIVKQEVKGEIAQLSDVKTSNINPFINDKHYSHLFIDQIYASSNQIIPCQSVFDIAVASRLGFKVVEGNVQATATEGKYIVMHGEGGKLGGQVYAIDGSDASSVVMSKTSFENLRTKYLYRSQYEKYQTPIISLEEFLCECKKYGIIPFVRYVDKTMLEITKSIVGDNFILYQGNRNDFDGMIYLWGSSTATKTEIFSLCESYGAPFMYAIHSDAVFTDEELTEIIKGVHERGCLIGWAGCYSDPVKNKKYLDMGFDFSGSAWDVNDFEHGNLVNAKADIDFSDFETTGTVTNEVLTLSAGDTVTVTGLNQYFLAKGSLHILFNGKINLKFGHKINNEFTSDGTSNSWFSTYFMNAAPTFTITATEQTTISMIDYRASKC